MRFLTNRLALLFLAITALVSVTFLTAQQPDAVLKTTGSGQLPNIAVPNLRGAGEAQQFMGVFNQRLQSQITGAGLFKVVSPSLYPQQFPQRPQDIQPNPNVGNRGGMALVDWAQPPVSANYLVFGYTGVQNNGLVLYGYLYDVTKPDPVNAQALGKVYVGTLDEAGARKVADEFAADILSLFGAKSLAGSKIYYTSTRSGNKEIWSMDYDGTNQKQFTRYASVCTFPALAADGSKIAFTNFTTRGPKILVHSLQTGNRLPFTNPEASLNSSPEFTPDGKQVLFSSTFTGGYANLYISDSSGNNLNRLTAVRAVEVEPKVNPRTGREVVFVSGRSGPPQIYLMNIDGTEVQRLTTGQGEAVNPSWSPDGKFIAFAWTRGFAPGNYNIFVMDVATRQVTQLTQGAGKNENPTWAPDGAHLVFSSTRSGTPQLWTMRADGTDLRQLTNSGWNEKPVWSRR